MMAGWIGCLSGYSLPNGIIQTEIKSGFDWSFLNSCQLINLISACFQFNKSALIEEWMKFDSRHWIQFMNSFKSNAGLSWLKTKAEMDNVDWLGELFLND